MNLNKYEKQEKEYLRMEKRYYEIRDAISELPLIPLPEPVQKGWEITQKLRDDIARRKDAGEILEAIKIGYYERVITNSEEEVKLIRKGKKEYTKTINKKRHVVNLRIGKKVLLEKNYELLDEKIKKYFYLDVFNEPYRKYGRKYYYIHIPDYYLVLRAKANILTHYRSKGGELEKEYGFLNNKLQNYWLTTGSYEKQFPKNKERTKTRDNIIKFMKGDIEDIYIEKVPLQYGD